jgi:hypothetical protein
VEEADIRDQESRRRNSVRTEGAMPGLLLSSEVLLINPFRLASHVLRV